MTVAFLNQAGEQRSFDVLVIGTGIAGLSFALALSDARPRTRIALLSKTKLPESNSYYAQGGIAAVGSGQDSLAQHEKDTLDSGAGLARSCVVADVIQAVPGYIQKLKAWGVCFDQDSKNKPVLAKEGGHSHRRIFHCGDQTGQAIIIALLKRIASHTNIHILEQHIVVQLLTRTYVCTPQDYGEVTGAYVLDIASGNIHAFLSDVVVLATGGAGKIYRYTTNPDTATGDGLAMAYRAGLRVGNLECYQFHPTLLYHLDLRNFLISEALRGEGAHLRLPGTGERFMQKYAPDHSELATRDVVARAIFNEIEQKGYTYVHLDIRHKSRAFLQKRFPNIYHTLAQLGIRIEKDLIPVIPAAHYLCGGVLASPSGCTDKNRLYAIGEVAFTGFHGANRLASNALAEAGVMAMGAAKDCIRWLDHPLPKQVVFRWNSSSVVDLRRASQINAHWRGLRGEMSSYAGIVRTEAGLKDLLQLILTRSQMIEDYYWKHTVTRDLIELRNIVLVAELIVRSALKRKETRGGHYREDYPHTCALAVETILQQSGLKEVMLPKSH